MRLLADLRAARAKLLDTPAREIAARLGAVGERFLADAHPLRLQALARLPASAGITPDMAAAVVDGMARDWTAERLLALLDAELGGGAPLDGFVAGDHGSVRALGPELALHILSGSVPGVSVTSMIRSLLVKSAVLLKPGHGDEVLPELFHRELQSAAPEIAAAAAVVYWQGGGGSAIETAALAEADLVVVYGGDETVSSVRARVPATSPVIAYPHRVSFGVVRAPGPTSSHEIALAAARSVAMFDQRGCVSPHLFYVLGSVGDAAPFAEALSLALAEVERELPSAPPDASLASALQQLRGTAELRSAGGEGRIWSGGRSTWTVLHEENPTFVPSCLGRVVRVKAASSTETILEAVRPFRRHLQTVGVAGLEDAARTELAEGLSRLGSVRIASLAGAPWPPPWWHHDGMGPLAALVRWSDLEG
jgi:hypothetical protein